MKKNEYGMTLDRNGYAPSILDGHCEFQCYACGRNGCGDPLDRHEIFGGCYREKSKRMGLWVHLCHSRCHMDGVHKDPKKMEELRRQGQLAAMERYGWDLEDFRREFGKNYMEEE